MNRDDTFVREQALNTQYSVIVRAPAGSGKTELLVSRYFKCLLNVPHPEMAVVLTFTQKAASELQERISYLIQNPSKAKTETMLKLAHAARHHADQLGWQLDRFPEILQIMTRIFLKNLSEVLSKCPRWTLSVRTRSKSYDGKYDRRFIRACPENRSVMSTYCSTFKNCLRKIILEYVSCTQCPYGDFSMPR
ncbi:MAG: hypothetical protein FJ161_03095 [Gammaproteobacteria bacterium]|nr:hypothetical protein [Gammaproteobacteria bacterium]